MYLKELRLYNFRKYKDATFSFSPKVNYICGKNAIGKTTILEAIYILITSKSFRSSQNLDLMNINASSFALEASFFKHNIEQHVKLVFDGKNKKIYINNSLCPSSANLLGLIYGISFTPDDSDLIKGAPSIRRHFLDLLIAQSDPLYVHYLSRYQKAMQQRNCLLKSRQFNILFPWEEEMAKAAEYILTKRKKAIDLLFPLIQKNYQSISREEETFNIELKSTLIKKNINIRENFLASLEKNRQREAELGFTLTGPHKDDLSFKISNNEMRYFGSEGQQRSAIASLRVSAWEKLYALVEEKPLMLIDDIGISLDSQRKRSLFDRLHSMGQVFLTSTEVSDYHFKEADQVIHLT